MSRHTDLVDDVNDANTEAQHNVAIAFLSGWRAGQSEAGIKWSFTEADFHTMERFGDDRPVCCGELLDWKPTP